MFMWEGHKFVMLPSNEPVHEDKASKTPTFLVSRSEEEFIGEMKSASAVFMLMLEMVGIQKE